MTDSLTVLSDPDLGNSSYLLDLGDGRALAVDPPRDLRAVRRAAADRGLRVAFAADTHLHADFLSGARQLAADEGALVLASRAGTREFAHRGLEDGDEVDLAGFTLRALATPGHTGEHLAFLLLDGRREVGVFTGGSLLAGSAARVDLSGAERTADLAAAQFRSLRRLAELDDAVAVWPTHGGGSFCSSGAGGATTTIGAERATNPLLAAPDESTFADLLARTMGSHPPYFLRLGEVNRRGPALLDRARLAAWSPARVATHLADGGLVIDTRPIRRFAAAHLPGSVSVAWRPGFTPWLGWLATPDRPVVFVRGDVPPGDLAWRARLIGLDQELAELAGGVEAWLADGRPTGALPVRRPADVPADTPLLDVRQANEYDARHVPGARHVELGTLAATVDRLARELPDGTVVMCGHGERATTAASLLARAGGAGFAVLAGGPADLVAP